MSSTPRRGMNGKFSKPLPTVQSTTLFSFFSRKPGSCGTPSPSKKASPKPPPLSTPRSDFSHENKQPPNKNKSASASASASASQTCILNPKVQQETLAKVQIGTKLSVYWPDDEEYYAASVTDIQISTKLKPNLNTKSDVIHTKIFHLLYEDGETEELDLMGERFRIIRQPKSNSQDQKTTKLKKLGVAKKSGSSSHKVKAKKHSEEMLLDTDEEIFEDELSSDDDDGSIFIGKEESDDDDDLTNDTAGIMSDLSNDGMGAAAAKAPQGIAPPASSQAMKRPAVTNPYAKKRSASVVSNTSSVPSSSSAKKPKTVNTITPTYSSTSNHFSSTQKKKTLATPKSLSSVTKNLTQSSSHFQSKPSTARPVITPTSYKTSSSPTNTAAATYSKPAPQMWMHGAVNPTGSHMHNHLPFLNPPHLKDMDGNLSTSPHYNPRTLQMQTSQILKLIQSPKLTPASEQWWHLKSHYYDTVLFFKTGKFYELYHMDADVGVKVCDFNYMKGRDAHAGFPEGGYGNVSRQFLRAGYKIARVEQTETPSMLAERKKRTKKGGKKPQVVNREVCGVTSVGTRTFCFLEDRTCFSPQSKNFNGGGAGGPMLVIYEKVLPPVSNDDGGVSPAVEYGICVMDCVTSIITLGEFADDVLRSRLNTLLTVFTPSEILLPRSSNDATTPKINKRVGNLEKAIRILLPTVRVDYISHSESAPIHSSALESSDREYTHRFRTGKCRPWNPEDTMTEIRHKKYFEESKLPEVLNACVEGGADLALGALGAGLFQLQRGLIDREVLGMGKLRAYVPPGSGVVPEPVVGGSEGREQLAVISSVMAATEDGLSSTPPRIQLSNPCTPQSVGTSTTNNSNPYSSQAPLLTQQTQLDVNTLHSESQTTHMQLDGTTLSNLEILTNQTDNTPRGSLWETLFAHKTKSPSGTKLLRAWLLRPLFGKLEIERRSLAVEELMSGSAAVALEEARAFLCQMGDLERLLTRVHSMGMGGGTADGNAPNDRAILYEGVQYNKRKVADFSKLLKGLSMAERAVSSFRNNNTHLRSALLKNATTVISEGGYFPDGFSEELAWFEERFDIDNAKANGSFEPTRGLDENYDGACDAVEEIQNALQDYEREMIRELHIPPKQWTYANTKDASKDKYLIELPVSIPVPPDFEIKGKRGSGKKQINKYRTPAVAELVVALEEALEERNAGKDRGMAVLCAKFDSRRGVWEAAAQVAALVDALGALAMISGLPGYSKPRILDCTADNGPCMQVEKGRHPCVDVTHSGNGFVPNDLSLGAGTQDDTSADDPAPRVLLLSGPNMGGKSTLLRQTCLLTILAQIGCHVPAQNFAVTPIDRIYTRLGASDRILSGQSTFFVELAETAAALRGATRRSLVIMDELGRGTSTFDGTAIASATVKHLVEQCGCLTLFATHYHSLLEDWKSETSVKLGHMECIVEGLEDDSDDENDHDELIKDIKATSDCNITFLYTLGEGACPRSFGINVARLAGLPEEVLQIAKERSHAFEMELQNHTHGTTTPNRGNDVSVTSSIDIVEDMEEEPDEFDNLYNQVSNLEMEAVKVIHEMEEALARNDAQSVMKLQSVMETRFASLL